jgi:hypothetical protein
MMTLCNLFVDPGDTVGEGRVANLLQRCLTGSQAQRTYRTSGRM